MALVASKTTPAEAPCLERSTRFFSAPRGAGGLTLCLRYGEKPSSLVDQDSAAYWWFGGAAAAVLAGVAFVVAPSIRTRRQSGH